MCIDRIHIYSVMAECGSHFIMCVHLFFPLSSFCSPVLLDVGVGVLHVGCGCGSGTECGWQWYWMLVWQCCWMRVW